jgi:hypothetical protein
MADTAVLDAPAADAAVAETTTTTTDTTTTTEPAKPAEVTVPATYNMQLPEGSTLDAAALERTAAIARELGLPDDASAQKVLALVHEQVAAREAALLASHAPGGEAWTKQVDGWKEETLKDPSLGKTPEERSAAIQRGHNVLTKIAEKHPEDAAAFKSFLEDSGLGNHPAAVRIFARLARWQANRRSSARAPAPPRRRTPAPSIPTRPT